MADSLSEMDQIIREKGRYLRRALVLVAILICGTPTLAQEEPTPHELELRAIEALARGQDATRRLAEILGPPEAPPPRLPGRTPPAS